MAANPPSSAVVGVNAAAGPSTPAPAPAPPTSGYNYEEDAETHPQKRYYFYVPSTILASTPMAAAIGFILGARRGAVKARLRFLAENAHRQPTTVQGWYFYTKTRNYRVFFAACKSGGRYAAGLGTAALAFTTAEEYLGYLREKYFPRPADALATPVDPKRTSWRKGPAHLEDGMLAGSLLTFFSGLAFRLPNPLLIRGVLVGFTLGAIFSGGLIVQDKMAYSIRQREIADEATAEVLEENPAAVAVPAASTLREGQSEAEKDKEAALVGSTEADATGEMGWMDWALFKTGLSGKKGDESKEKA